jgi:hypothetical protein
MWPIDQLYIELGSLALDIELVSKTLNHLAAILQHYARSLIFTGLDLYEVKKVTIIFQKEKGNTCTLLIIFIVKSFQKEQNSTYLLQGISY